MSLSAKMRRAPMRIATGAYILNSGVTKLGADDDAAKSLHGMASGTYGFVGKADPKVFAKALGAGEIAVGAALLLPIVPAFVAGAALAGFSGALLNMYWNTPGLHEEGSPRPTSQGMPLAKDVWMFGMGVGLMADAALEPAHDRVIELESAVSHKRSARKGRAQRSAKKAARRAKQANTHYVEQVRTNALELQGEAAKRARKARANALEWQDDAAKRARKAGKKAGKRAGKASESAAERLAELRDEYAPVALDKARAAREAARQAAQEYGPVAAEKARAARDAARDLAEEYGPVAAEKARAARDAARDLAEEYGPVAAEKAKMARHMAQEYAAKAQEYGAKARERVTT
jgi:uncharacterized membrane protein YphA (DoxX/SURF4 family)